MQSCARIDRACIDALIEQLDSRLPSFITDDNILNIRKFSVEIASLVLTIMLSMVILKKFAFEFVNSYKLRNFLPLSLQAEQYKKN
jgi:hypothetical protein